MSKSHSTKLSESSYSPSYQLKIRVSEREKDKEHQEVKMNKGDSCDDILPKFFKFYLSDEYADDLELPVSFTSLLPNPLPKTVTVRSISGKIWTLAFRKCCGEVERIAMVNGWKRIAKDENLKPGDFLEFEFDGSRLFNFCIYEHETMCKRTIKCAEQSEEIGVESDSEEETQASDESLSLDEDDEDDEEAEVSDYKSDDYDVNDASIEDDEDVEAVIGDDAAEDDDTKYLDDPMNPSFTLRLNPEKQSQLLIPTPVIKDYSLHFPESITLVDPLAPNFGTLEKQIKIQTNGSVFVKGFGSIIRRNKVKTTDKMICEIKKTGANNLVQAIKIHIISG